MPPPDSGNQNSPLAPSVEKAYYRKCIELKRRLNEVEAANDEAKIKRVRLDRAIMKMRLERAFLLDELRKRMDYNADGSEASGDEGMTTPPGDRPHRDKRRRQHPIQPAAPPQPVLSHAHPPPLYPPPAVAQRVPSQPEGANAPLVPGPGGVSVPANAMDAEGRYIYIPPHELAALHPQHQVPTSIPPQPHPHGSPYGAPVGVPGASDRRMNGMNLDGAADEEREAPVNREAGATGEALSAGPPIVENANGERTIVPTTSNESGNAQAERRENSGEGGFTAVNQ